MPAQHVVVLFEHKHDCAHAHRQVQRHLIATAGEVELVAPRCTDTRFMFAELEVVEIMTVEP